MIHQMRLSVVIVALGTFPMESSKDKHKKIGISYPCQTPKIRRQNPGAFLRTTKETRTLSLAPPGPTFWGAWGGLIKGASSGLKGAQGHLKWCKSGLKWPKRGVFRPRKGPWIMTPNLVSPFLTNYRWHQNNYIHKKFSRELICVMCSVTYT